MASSANILPHSTLYSIIFSKQENIFIRRLIVPADSRLSRAGDSQVTSVCANSSNKIHFQKVKSPQIFAGGPQATRGGHTHTHTHKDVDTLGWLAVSGTPELSQPANILAVNCHTCRGYWQAAELWKQLYLRVGTRTDAEKKMCWLYTKA